MAAFPHVCPSTRSARVLVDDHALWLAQVVAVGSARWLRVSVNQAAASIEGEVLEDVRSIARHDG
jgi:hypothetical protein